MLKTLRNAWGIVELRKKILFTLFIILMYRLGNAVPVPYVNTTLLESYFNTVNNTILGLWNTMSGGSFSMATIFALSIQPYINASIIIQLLTIAIPALERLAKEGGEEGRKKLASITRYTTVAIGLVMGIAYYTLMSNAEHADLRRPGRLARHSHHHDLHGRLRPHHVDGRADNRVRCRQRHLHHPVRQHRGPLPDQHPGPWSPTWATAPWPGGPSSARSSALLPLSSA